MGTALRTILLVLLFAIITQIQFNLDADKTATRQMKNALEIATHDAALAVDPISFSNGKIIFQNGETVNGNLLPNNALENFKKSIESNLNVSSSGGYLYTPTSNSFFKNNLSLVELIYLDDRVDRTYPFTYSHPEYDFTQNIDGPSVIAIMITESPRWFVGGTTVIRQAAVYEYKK